jgi:UDP-GlcNAc:undecaprenyl-phosphate GlcNAc-1-phosphate transferase
MPNDLIVFLATAVGSGILVGLILKLSHINSWYDHINERKVHSGDVPRLGGIGFSLVFVITAGILVFLFRKGDAPFRFLPCLAGICIIVVAGVWDDFHPMSPLGKFLTQIAAALCVVIPGYTFQRLFFYNETLFAGIPFLNQAITIFWIVGMTNAINLIDGIDALAGGVSTIIAFTFALIFSFSGETPAAELICFAMAGAVTGFLFFNAPFPKAKIFMGDGGSQFLGFTLALLPLLEEHRTSAALLEETEMRAALPVLYAAALLVIPIFDTIAAVWRRIRDKQNIYTPDRAHVHHKLMNLGLSVMQIDIVLFGLQLVISVLVLASVHFQGLLSLVFLGIAYLVALVFFAVIHFANRKRPRPPAA